MSPKAAPGETSARDYLLCGWRVRSTLALPEAMPWTGDERPPDVCVRFGSVPDLPNPVTLGQIQVGEDGSGRIGVKGIADFFVREGREVIVEPHKDPAAPDFRAWLLGPILGILCHQRGIFPLHASCVAIGGAAAAFTGRSGAGKSTLAACLVRRGHGLVADDVCAISGAASDAPIVLPSFPRLKLWEDSLDALQQPTDEMTRAPVGKNKFEFHQPHRFHASPIGLRAIYLLSPAGAPGGEEIRQIDRAEVFPILSNDIYRRQAGFHLGRKTALLTEVMRMASTVPMFRLPVDRDFAQLDAVAARIEAHLASLSP